MSTPAGAYLVNCDGPNGATRSAVAFYNPFLYANGNDNTQPQKFAYTSNSGYTNWEGSQQCEFLKTPKYSYNILLPRSINDPFLTSLDTPSQPSSSPTAPNSCGVSIPTAATNPRAPDAARPRTRTARCGRCSGTAALTCSRRPTGTNARRFIT